MTIKEIRKEYINRVARDLQVYKKIGINETVALNIANNNFDLVEKRLAENGLTI